MIVAIRHSRTSTRFRQNVNRKNPGRKKNRRTFTANTTRSSRLAFKIPIINTQIERSAMRLARGTAFFGNVIVLKYPLLPDYA
jgi:hypothetical protein